ncbi:MAG: AAA family ATPase [Thiomargarita sp.]|nr:AAA family ATPase [Thiomargarita sp.]
MNISNYNIIKPIYESANSVVYRGRRNEDNQPIILKMLKEDYPTPAELTRYQQEYEITHNFDLAGVIKAYGIEKYQNTLIIVLEDFGGDSLKQLMGERSLVKEFLPFAIEIADSLGNIHAANIIHKDINPSNIVVNSTTQQLKIIDFGIASRLSRENPTLKNPEQLEGTLAYLSPEQTGRINRCIDYRTDLYSLGVTFYEMLTGELPFKSTDAIELVHAHIAKTPVPVNKVNTQVPQIISELVMKLMAKNAEDRYQSAFGVKADLENCLENQRHFENSVDFSFQLAQNDFSEQFKIPQKLYGRENEVNILLQSFERVSQGAAEMMLIAGYSGVGKTALVHEVHKPMTEKRGYFAAGKFDQYQRNLPYFAITQAFNAFCNYLLTESVSQLNQWQEKIRNAVGNNGQVLIDVIPQLELIIGKQQPVAQIAPSEAQNRFNLVFQNFFRVLCQKDHPLILFIDDLQWADLASLNLLFSLMTEANHHYFFIIGAYRDNEVDATHPLMMLLEKLQKKAIVNTIQLQNLSLADVNTLIAEALICHSDQALPLTDLVYEKTQGNAFFTHEFLKCMYKKELLVFEIKEQKWQWALSKIAALDLTDNVIELMANKIEQFPADTQTVLKLAACIGNEFDLALLSTIYQHPVEILTPLLNAVEEGLLLPLDENYKLKEATARFKFQHDRIQQAAYSLMAETEKPAIHQQIARYLLSNSKEGEVSLFKIVDHFNFSIELVNRQEEKNEIAQLNLQAAQKAKATTAYQAAVNYLNVGRKLLSEDSWETEYDLTLNLYVESVESFYLNINYEEADTFSDIVLQQAKTVLDKIKVYEIKILFHSALNQQQTALDIGLQVIEMLNISLSKKQPENGELSAFIHLPAMTDPDKLAAQRILMHLWDSAIMLNSKQLLPIAFTMMELSIKHGNSYLSAFGYAFYGLILCGTQEDIEKGNQFGRLALRLLERYPDAEIKVRVIEVFNAHTRHWKEHAKEIIAPLHENIQLALEIGDIGFACYNVMHYCTNYFLIGQPLEDVIKAQMPYIGFIRNLKQEFPLIYASIWTQLALNLSSQSSERQLIGDVFDEIKMLPVLQKDNNILLLVMVYLAKTILSYLLKDKEQALANATLAANCKPPIATQLPIGQGPFYYSLALLANYPTAETAEQATQYIEKVAANQEQLQFWASHAPSNYQHKYDLVEAERARISGEKWRAAELYEKAIVGAKKQEYLQEEALAYELAAEFYLGEGMEKIAQTYMRDAHYAYQQWGAIVKVKDLEKRYPQWLVEFTPFPPQQSTVLTSSHRQSTSTLLDLDSVIKAAQTLSGEIVLSKLLKRMMHILIENAGAERGLLLKKEEGNGEWIIEAEGVFNVDEVTLLQSISLSGYLPTTIVNYVARTHQFVVLANAMQEGIYTEDRYIQQHQLKSVLCIPIIHQGELISILYLENNVTQGAFTEARLNTLEILSSQAAISIENALLYQTQEQKVRERTAQLNNKVEELTQTRNELVQSEKMASLGRLVAGFAHEVNTPIGVAVGSASVLQRKSKLINKLLDEEEVDEEELISALEKIDEAAKLTLSNLKRAADLISRFKRTAVDQTSEEIRRFDVKSIIEDVINTLHNKFKQTAISIQLDCLEHLNIYSVPGTLEQILTNLMMNSLIHGFEEGKKNGRIIIAIRLEDARLLINYSDTGKGISPDALEKVFEPFFTTHRAHGGTGLGLYICYNLVTSQLHGTMTCESRLNKGVTFKIEFPVALSLPEQ